jgi:exoribonuclease II
VFQGMLKKFDIVVCSKDSLLLKTLNQVFVWQSIIELIEGHLALKEEEDFFLNVDSTTKKTYYISSNHVSSVMYLDKMFNVLQTCSYIFWHIPKPQKNQIGTKMIFVSTLKYQDPTMHM